MTAESYQQAYLARLVSASLVPVGYNKAIHLHDDDDDDDDDEDDNNNNNNNNKTTTMCDNSQPGRHPPLNDCCQNVETKNVKIAVSQENYT